MYAGGLQTCLLDALNIYHKHNQDKTMVISNEKKKNHKVSSSFNGKKLKITTEFTCLGIKINSAGSLKPIQAGGGGGRGGEAQCALSTRFCLAVLKRFVAG